MHDIEVRVYRSAIKIPVIFFVPAAFLATLYSLAYLYLNSNLFLVTLHETLNEVFPGTIEVREVVLEPTLVDARIFNGRLMAREGHDVIRLREASTSLNPATLLTRRLELYDLVVHEGWVRMTWPKAGEEGSFDMLEALGVVSEDDEEDVEDGFLEGITLRNVACIECSYGLNLHFFKVEVPVVNIPDGRVDISSTVQISVPALEVDTIKLWFSNTLFGFPEARGPWSFDVNDVQLRRWMWTNDGFNVEYLGLESEGVMAWASGYMRFPESEDSDETQMYYKAEGQFYIPYRTNLIQYFLDDLIHVEATLSAAVEGSLDEIDGRFRLEAPVLEALDLYLRDIEAEGYLRDDVIVSDGLSAKLYGGTAELDRVAFSMFEGLWSVSGRLEGVDPAPLLADRDLDYPWLAGSARGNISAMGWVPFSPEVRRPGDDPVLRRWAEARNPMAWVRLDSDVILDRSTSELLPGTRLRLGKGAEIWTTQEAAIVEDLRAYFPDMDAQVQNFRFNWVKGVLEQGPEPGPARIKLNAPQLPELLKHYDISGVQGSAVAELLVRERLNYPDMTFSGKWSSPGIVAEGEPLRFDEVAFRGALKNGLVTFEPLDIQTEKGDLKLDGSARVLRNPKGVIDPETGTDTGEFLFLNNPYLEMKYTLSGVDVAYFDAWLGLGSNTRGTLNAKGQVSGAASAPRVEVDGSLRTGEVMGQLVDELVVKGMVSPTQFDIDEVRLDAGAAGTMTARGSGRFNGDDLEVWAEGQDIELALLDPLVKRSAVTVEGLGQFNVHATGSFRRPQIGGYANVDSLRVDGRDLGDASTVINTLNEAVHITGALSEMGGILAEVPLDAESPYYGRLVLDNLDLKEKVRELSDTELVEGARTTGSVEVFLSPDLERYQVLLNLSDLELNTLGRRFVNDGPLIVGINDGTLFQIQRAKVGADGRFVELEGGLFLDEALLDIAARGELDLALVNSFRATFPEYFPDAVVEASGMVELDTSLRGTPEGFVADGYVRLLPSQIQLRDINTPVVLSSGMIRFGENGVKIDDQDPVRGRALDGAFELRGGLSVVDAVVQDLRLQLRGVNMSYRIPEMANLTFATDVELNARDLDRPETWSATGLVDIVDGLYYQNISVFQEQFTNRLLGAFNRTSQTYEASLIERIPWLEDVNFDLQIRARDSFRIRSEIDRLGLDLELRMDVRLQETLANPRMVGGVDIIDGKVQFQNEFFDVRSGTLTFEGNPENPRVDIIADADINNRCRQTDFAETTQDTLRLTGDVGRDEELAYRIVLNVSGRLDNLDVRFESNPYADQRDVLSLILTGCTVDQLTASSASSPTLEVALAPVLGWIEGTVQDVVAVEEFTITPSVDRLRTSIGDRLSRRTTWRLEVDTGLTQSTGGQRYELNYKISDSWSAQLSESTRTENESFVIDFKLRYRLLLD